MVETQNVVKQLRVYLKKCVTPHNAPSKVQAVPRSPRREVTPGLQGLKTVFLIESVVHKRL